MERKEIVFRHTIKLRVDPITTEVDFDVREKRFTLFLDRTFPPSQTIISWLDSGTLYEADVSGAMCKLVKPGDKVVDIGANIGFHTCLLASLVEKNGVVLAFEPVEQNVFEIRSNQSFNAFKHIEVRKKLLGETSGELVDFHSSPVNSGTSYAIKTRDKVDLNWDQMETHQLDEEISTSEKIKLVKIDVEGFEGKVLRGATQLLKSESVKYWIVEYAQHCLKRNGDSLESIRKLMATYGLEMFILDVQGGFPKLWPAKLHIRSKYISNLLFAKLEELAEDWVVDDITRLVSQPDQW